MNHWFDIIFVSVIYTGVHACSRVGSNVQPTSPGSGASNFIEEEGLFLNLGAPSQCQGMVTAWHLRYQLKDCEVAGPTKTKTNTGSQSHSRSRRSGRENGVFAVYRPINNHTMEYKIVPGSIKSIMIACDDDSTTGDDDKTDDDDDDTSSHDQSRRSRSRRSKTIQREEVISLEAEEQFMIEKGDIIALCLPDVSSRYRLEIVEDTENSGIITVYEYWPKRRDVRDCNLSDDLQMIKSPLTARPSYQLNIQAEIAGIVTTTATEPTLHTSIATDDTQTLLNDTRQSSDTANQGYLRTAVPAASACGGLLVLIAVVLLVIGIAVCRNKSRQTNSLVTTSSSVVAPTDVNEVADTDQQTRSVQRRVASATTMTTVLASTDFELEKNVAYRAYELPEHEHVYVEPYSYSHSHSTVHNDYETITSY